MITTITKRDGRQVFFDINKIASAIDKAFQATVGAKDYSEDNYVFTFHSEAKGKCAVVFSPKEKILDGIRPYLKHDVSRKLYLSK